MKNNLLNSSSLKYMEIDPGSEWRKMSGYDKESVVDPNSLNLDPDPEFWTNFVSKIVLTISREKM